MFAMRKYFGVEDSSRYHYLSYDHLLPAFEPGDVVYIADYSRPASELISLFEQGVQVIINDHHESALVQAIFAMEKLRFHPKFEIRKIVGDEGTLSGLDEILQPGVTKQQIEDWIDKFNVKRVAYSIKDGDRQLRINIDMTRCGSYLMWEYLFADTPPKLFQYIDTRDRWVWELLHAEEVTEGWGKVVAEYHEQLVDRILKDARADILHPLNFLANSIVEPPDYMLKRKIVEHVDLAKEEYELYQKWMLNPKAIEELRELGTPLVEERQEFVRDVASKATWAYFLGHWVPIVEAYQQYTWVGHELLKQYPKAPFSVTYKVVAEGDRLQFSLRSRPGFRCNRVAELLGGGGQQCASGLTLTKFKLFDTAKKFGVPDVVINNGVPIRVDNPQTDVGLTQMPDTYVFAIKE